ncbi:uncharacterized protein LOC101206733 isoform X2 [Cucumis sativus]|uniref:uncharacterized protein LOC101206733 isoform X2 n=1 Tax=Cucumis sativus TaxID=3659 RepID=UPI0012F4E0AC|nr:uncharacterized protein LOC101206733 isoform X2 [Cucumis sativus]
MKPSSSSAMAIISHSRTSPHINREGTCGRVTSWGKEIEPKNVMNRLCEEERYMRNNCGLHHILSNLCSFLLPNHFLSSLELYGCACAWYSIAVRLAMELEVLDANYLSKLNKNFRCS